MAKGKSTWKYNKLLTGRNHYFKFGDFLFKPNESGNITNRGINNLSGLGTGIIGAAGQIGGGLIGGGYQSGAGNVLQGLSGIASAIPGPWGAVASAGLGVLGGLTNRMFGSKMNTENIAKVEANINNLNNFQSNASDFDTLSNNWANADVGMTFSDSFIGKDGWFSNKAKNKAADLRRQIDAGNAWVQNTLVNNAENIGTTQMQNLLGNYAAFGGPLLFSKGGSIHIKPKNRGKFTETKRRTGKTTEELTHSSNPLTRKRAIFAQNAKKWHHAFGGELNTQGGDFTNGLLYIDNGGSHEANPYEGVPLGMDPEGTPNLVEEGETVFNDYVFSKRLKVPKAIREKYKLRSTKDMTFAEMSKQMAKESEERSNDPISKRGLEALMSELANAQEALKAEKNPNMFYNGGKANKFDGESTPSNQMVNYDWAPFLQALSGYTSSRIRGNINGKYKPDVYMPTSSPYMLGATDLKALEDMDEYKAFTDAMIANPDLDYLRALDSGVAEGVTKLFDSDNNLRNDWSTIFRNRRMDGKGGIYHFTPLRLKSDNTTTPAAKNTSTETSSETPTEKAKKHLYEYYYNSGTYDNPNYVLSTEENAPLWMRNNKYYFSSKDEGDGVTRYYYDPREEPEQGKYASWLRYAPSVGFGIGALTDMLGITNRPDYANANTVLEASKGAGTYQPVRFNPIGNYLTYNPFDRDYYINKINAEAGAARRGILNTSGGNRAQAMAGILASDYNTQGKMGDLFRQAEEYNLEQRRKVEDFNRGTNITNSQGFLQADLANQKALAGARELSLKGAMTAAQMREASRQAADANKSANLSGLFQTLGDIGYEQQSAKMLDNLIRHSYVPGGEDFGFRAYGGKTKRRKGLTF